MGDNPIYWPGHQNPTSWQQTQQLPASATQQQLNSMTHYNPNPAAASTQQQQQAGMQPPSLQQQHQMQTHQQQAGIYQNMMPTGGGVAPPPPQQSSHYPHQYSSYWNSAPPPPLPPHTQPPTGAPYHPGQQAASSTGQPVPPAFHKDIQADNSHMMSPYDRRATQATMSHQQQKHPSAMMQAPSSNQQATSNLSPTQSQLSSMQARAAAAAAVAGSQSSQLSSIPPSLQQQPPPSNWSSTGYYAQPPNQSPYSSVMNPYMPSSYGSSAAASAGGIPNHTPSSMLQQQPQATRPAISNQSTKPSTNGSDRARASYPPPPPPTAQQSHAIASMYNQSSISGPSAVQPTNGSYYGYDSYYSQAMAGQATSDSYLSHQSAASTNPSTQHWPQASNSNQMISNSSVTQPPQNPSTMRPITGPGASSIHPQSPSATVASSTLPLASRQPPTSQTPDRSPAPQSTTSYPSPGQQTGSSTKSAASNSLAQLEQMVMPGSGGVGQNSAQPSTKSPSHRSSTDSPTTSIQQQQQLQSSYNAASQSGYFAASSATSAPTNQSSYYPSYDPSAVEMQKSNWSDPNSMNPMNSQNSGPLMMDSSQNSYGQTNYDGTTSYNEYTNLSVPSNSNQPRFSAPGDNLDMHQSADKADPYAIDSQTFDDYDDRSSTSKTKKGRAKKGEEKVKKNDDKVKKERKPRAPRAPKGASSSSQSSSLTPTTPVQTLTPQMQDSISTPPYQVPAPLTSPNRLQNFQNKSQPTDLMPINDQLQPTSDNCSTSARATNGSYYGYDSYYNQSIANQSTSESYIPHQNAATASSSSQAWNQSNNSSQMISNSNVTQPLQTSTTTRQLPISTASNMPQSSPTTTIASTTLPSASRQPTAPQTPDKSPVPQSTTPYQSPGHQSNSATKPTPTNTLAQSDQLSSSINQTSSQPTIKSPSHRSSTDSPNVSIQQQPQLQAPYGSSQGYFSGTSASIPSTQSNYYPQYESSSVDVPKPSWSDSAPINPINTPNSGLMMMDTSQSSYGQPNYDVSTSYNEYTNLSVPTNSSQPRFPTPGDNLDLQSSTDKTDSNVVEPQSNDNEQLSTPKPKKSRAKKSEDKTKKTEEKVEKDDDKVKKSGEKVKKGEDKVKKLDEKAKKERKPRAPRASKGASSSTQPSSPAPNTPMQESTSQMQDSLSASSHNIQPSSPSQVQNAEIEPFTETKPATNQKPYQLSTRVKKLPRFALKFAKTKKRKRLGSSDNDQSDLDKTPPPSPDEVESGVQKRRSARNTKKLKYNDDIELGFSDSDDSAPTNTKSKKVTSSSTTVTADGILEDTIVNDEPTVISAPVEDTMVVEKIMATRTGQRELEPEPGEVLPPDGTHIEVEEFYVKYKNLSYLHCDWRTLEELEKGDRRISQKIKRYKQKKDSSNLFSFMDEEPFDPQYCEVDRILAVNEIEEMIPDSDDEAQGDVKTTNDISKEFSTNQKETAANENEPLSNLQDGKSLEIEKGLADVESVEPIKSTVVNPENEVETETVDEAEKDNLIESKVVEDNLQSGIEVGVTRSSQSDQIESEKMEVDKENIVTDSASSEPNETDQPKESTDVVADNNVEAKPRKMKKKISRHYLVKWRGLGYDESTWELEEDLDTEKIKQFNRFKDPPPKSKWKPVKRPKPEEWVRKETSPVYKNNNTLREYQLEGINWLSFCWHQGRNCILADEMGLGKTIQSIAFINEIYQYGINGPFLIIVPLSTVGNWAREFETWTDLNVITYHGSSLSRDLLKDYEMFYKSDQVKINYYKFQVMITTFEIILSDCLDLREIPWRCCIIDEAHRLKNRNCKLLEGLRLLNMEHRVLLTGTPLQNNVEELFSLLNFLEPNQFSSTEQFLQEFGDLKTEAQVDKLKLILKPMMLRRLKEDVEKTLAPKEETIVEVELTNIQKKYYRAILEKNFSFLSKGTSSNNMPNLMNTMMELRKCCIHPYLINGAEEQILYEARQTKLAGGEMMSSFQAMVNSSGKLVLIDKLLPRLRADGHRVLIFSQMVRCLDILEDYVTHKHYPFERIDGRVRGSERQQAIDRFSKPGSDRFVFLLCTRAGGLGINLTAADTVIIFDSDWNPQNDLQAQARCHRIGQSKAVKIYRLICRNTYEREMFDKASLKLGLDKAVLQSMNTQKNGTGGIDGQLTKKEIEELLKKGAYGALMDDDNAGDKFCEEDIDQILQRRTQVITIDNSEAKGSTFSKATFSSSNNREDIELDDPNFWEKWAKKANIESDDFLGKDELIQLAPRRRTQTKRYGADGNLIDISDLDSSEEDEETISMRTRGSRGRQPKLTPASGSKRNKRRQFEFDDEDFLAGLNSTYWSKGDCLKVEKGLLTYGWGRWEEIIASNRYKRDLTPEDCESICRIILLYCLNNYKGDEKIKSSAWDLITPDEELNKSQSESEGGHSTRGRKPKSFPLLPRKSTAEEIADAQWTKEPKNDPEIALPDDQYKRHLQRNCNR